MLEIKAVPGKLIMLGKQGENLAREVVFDVSGVRAEFGDGAFRLSAKRPGESDAYPATVTETGDTVVWALTGADTQNAGRGQCELAYYAGETRLKTWTYDTAIAKSLTGSPKTDPYDEFLDEVNRLVAEAAISQREAKNSENAAKTSEENAKASETAAKTSEDNATAYAQAALAAEKKSEQNAENATSAAVSAGQYAQNAAVSATNAANSASAAENHEKGAKDAATAAAKSAEGLADAVKRAEDAATAAQDNAGKTAADREAVAGIKTAAETAQSNAEKSATSAAGSATSAGESATAAETSRTGAAEIKAQIDEIKAEIDQAKADIDQTKTDTLAAKTSAETAAATATEKAAEIADSAAQIATNTENIETNATDIDLLRRENVELKAKTDALWKLSEGKSYDFVEDATEAYSKDVPTGCRFAQVEKIGGKTVAWNQWVDETKYKDATSASVTTTISGRRITIAGTSGSSGENFNIIDRSAKTWSIVANHYYLFAGINKLIGLSISAYNGAKAVTIAYAGSTAKNAVFKPTFSGISQLYFNAGDAGVAVDVDCTPYLIDLTRLYGSGNEPTTAEDPRIAEIIAYAEKHPGYNPGELVSAGVTDVEVGFPEQSGSTVTISDGIDGHALDITASWTPTQAGSGDPSPENIRPISGRDKITLTRTAGSDVQTSTLSLPETIYGGSVDQDGNGVKEWVLLTLDGTEEWREDDADNAKHRYALSIYNLDVRYEGAYKMCDRLKWTGSTAVNNGYDYGVYYMSSVWLVVFDKSNHFSGLDAWKSYLTAQKAAGTPMTVAYKLATPTTFTATGAKTITAKSGVNSITSNANSITVKYAEDVYPIPDAVKALPGYGWSVGSVCNEIVRRADGWDYVQRVGLPATTDGYTALAAPITTDITDLMTGALPLMTTEPGGTITMHHALADDGLTVDVPSTIKYIRDLKEVASSDTE